MIKVAILLFVILLSASVCANIPNYMTTQQIIRDKSTNSLVTGTKIINYSIYKSSDNSLLWRESINTTLDNGIASNIIGLTNPILYTYFLNPYYWVLNIDDGENITFNGTPVETAKVAEYALNVNWSNISNIPNDILDGDNDTKYTHLSNFTNDVDFYNGSRLNEQYLNLSGGNANQNIDIGSYGFSATNLTTNIISSGGNSINFTKDLMPSGVGINIGSPTERLGEIFVNIWDGGSYIYMNDGSVTNPSYSFSSDPNTGILRTGDDIIGFSTGGTLRARLTTANFEVLSADFASLDNLRVGATSGESITLNGNDMWVQGDAEIKGKIYSNDWSNVSITESQINDLGTYILKNGTTTNLSLDNLKPLNIGNITFFGDLQMQNYDINTSGDYLSSGRIVVNSPGGIGASLVNVAPIGTYDYTIIFSIISDFNVPYVSAPLFFRANFVDSDSDTATRQMRAVWGEVNDKKDRNGTTSMQAYYGLVDSSIFPTIGTKDYQGVWIVMDDFFMNFPSGSANATRTGLNLDFQDIVDFSPSTSWWDNIGIDISGVYSANARNSIAIKSNGGDWQMKNDGSNGKLRLGADLDANISWDGTNLVFEYGNGSVFAWFSGNVSALDYYTRTSVYDKRKGKALDFIHDSDYYKIGNKINHKKFYGYKTYEVTDYNNCWEVLDKREYCFNRTMQNPSTSETKIVEICQEKVPDGVKYWIVDYNRTECGKKTEEAVSLNDEIDVLRQAIFELKTENNQLKSELCKEKSYSWCKIK